MRRLITALALAGMASGILAQSLKEGVYTDQQADRGEQLYPDECGRCHGDELEGDEAPALQGGEFLTDWKGKTLADLFERIRVSMPGDHPGKLTRQQTADVLAFVLRANHFPAGNSELPTDTPALRRIPL